jgi:hypothetical protein
MSSENGSVGVTTPTQEELALALAGAMDETAQKASAHATVLREQGERLLRDAARLEQSATRLLAGAEQLGIEVAGETPDEVQEAADYGTTVNNRGDRIDWGRCVSEAQRLGRFDRARFEEALSLKRTVASRWLARLRERGVLDTVENDDGAVIYDFVRPEGGSAPRPRGESPEEMARRLVPDLADEERERGRAVDNTGRSMGPKQRKRNAGVLGRKHPGRR